LQADRFFLIKRNPEGNSDTARYLSDATRWRNMNVTGGHRATLLVWLLRILVRNNLRNADYHPIENPAGRIVDKRPYVPEKALKKALAATVTNRFYQVRWLITMD